MQSRFLQTWFVVGLGFALGIPATARAQQMGDMDSLSRGFDQNSTRRSELFKGEVTASGAGDKKIAENCAKWYIWRITHAKVLLNQTSVVKVHNEFNRDVSFMMDARLRLRNRSFVDMFGPELVECMKEALAANSSGQPETVVNACMMIPTMAKLKQNNIGDYLVSLVSDPKTDDVIRMYALKGLSEFFPADSHDGQNTDLTDKRVLAKKARDIKYIDTLVKYIETPVKTKGLLPEEAAVVNYLRREAIIALAQAEVPAVATLKKVGKAEGAVAPTLMRVCAGNLEPAPTLHEKIEAALGLCKMKYWNPTGDPRIKHAHQPDYQPELAIYLVGRTLSDFIGAYKSDFGNFADVKSSGRKPPRFSFKIDAKRFDAALKDLSENARGATKKADQLYNAAKPVLTKITRYDMVENDATLRQQVIPALRPKNAYPFKTLKLPEIPLEP